MPISLPNLDDRRYEDLVEEALALIPVHAPEWTNHNSSDPGITLIELFAYLTEMLIYRLNRITVENRLAFLNLIDAGSRTRDDYRDPNKLKEETRRVIANLRKPARAVTAEDYESLVLEKFSDEISRARAVPGRDLSPLSKTQDPSAHISVVVVPAPPKVLVSSVKGITDYMKRIEDYLEPLRLLTTIVHVVEPTYVRIGVRLTLHLEPDAVETTVRQAALTELSNFFHPGIGWRDGKGWPFGRDVYLSEIIERLVHVRGVDYVTRTKDERDRYVPALRVISPNTKTVIDDSVSLEPHELVDFSVSDTTFTVPPPPQRDLRA
jgi:hypothetical protein